MNVTGDLFIGCEQVRTVSTFRALNPATGETLDPPISIADEAAVRRSCELAWLAFDSYRELKGEVRAQFLEAIAAQILALGDEVLERAHMESGLPLARLNGERTRTIGQLRLFADELRKGGWCGIRIDPAMPDRKPLPRPDLRLRRIPLGPVAVFGASNFPLAFSVAGGDTAAALAAGCPVIVKGHPAHPGTSDLIAQAIVAAVREQRLPAGVFSMLNGNTNALGAVLVADPRIKAVGFTGSRAGGLALMKVANERLEPIPVYAEMSSINPVLLLPGALAERADALGKEFVASLTQGVGQFCTNPGVVLALQGADLDRFIASASAALGDVAPAVMLTPGIHDNYEKALARLVAHPAVATVARGADLTGLNCARGALFAVPAGEVIAQPDLLEEVFGPAAIIIGCSSQAQMVDVLESLEGQLTATVHLGIEDASMAARLLPILERKAGRLIANGWPTGVEVAHAMVHGGPFPATSDGRSTSVGTLSIERFLRPVCYQDFPDALLPAVLRRDA